MLPRWIILGLSLAGIAYGTVVWWPEKPVWKTRVSRFSEVLSFSPDYQTIYVLDEKREDVNEPRKPHVSRWDARTGMLLGETAISLPDHVDGAEYRLSSDGTALVAGGRVRNESGLGPAVFYVFEIPTGQRRLGPLNGELANFSRTGRWIVGYFFNKDNPADDAGIEVVDSKTGKCVLSVKNFGESSVKSVCFAQDDSAIAVLQKKHGADDDFSLQIFDLRSGKESARLPLTKREWFNLRTWEGHSVTALAQEHNAVRAFTIDLQSVPIGKEADANEPLRLPAWEIARGEDWRADVELNQLEETWIRKQWNELVEWLGANKLAFTGLDCRLRVWDRETFRIKYQSPWFVNSSFNMAINGVAYAVMSDAGELSLWKAESHLRWPWALVLSLSILAATLLIGRWRAKGIHS